MAETPVSIVIPVLNEAAGLQPFLESLQALRARGHELLVVDGGSHDGTPTLAKGLVDRVLFTRTGRAVQMNAGAAAAAHDILLFLHADTRLPENALSLVTAALEKRDWGRFDVCIEGGGLLLGLVARAMNMRSRLSGIATGDQAIFVKRALFERVGGYPAIPLMEDVVLSAALRQCGRPACLGSRIRVSGRRWQQQGIVRTVLLMWWLRLAWFLGASAHALAKRYYPAQRFAVQPEHDDTVILLFARAPQPGRVKTRLAKGIGEAAACRVHTSLLFRQLGWLQATALCHVELWVTGDSEAPVFRNSGLPVHMQCDGDLGQRMQQAAVAALQRYRQVILMGSDCPSLNETILTEVIAALVKHEVVLVPALDGGYVLLGLRRDLPAIFHDMPWSTDRVMAETLRRLDASSVDYHLLPACRDIDTAEDLTKALDAGFHISGID